MKSRYMSIMYVGMVFAAFAAGFHYLGQISRSLPRNPIKERTASALPAEIPEATLADIRNSLEKQEYHISYDEQKKKLQSPNRRNNIRAYYEPGKLTVQTRVDTTGEGFKVELINEGIFADGHLLYKPEADAKADHHENKVQISHDAFTEEFINNEDGVRQNFIVQNAPEGTRELQVKMTANGLKVEQGSGNELRFYSEKPNRQTRNELVYSDIKCWDANKKPLNAMLAYVENRIQITVEVANAAYPVTIDPIIANGTPQNANKVLEINQSTMWLGFSVSSAGDVNGDGYSDVIVGAPQYDLGQDNEGGAFVYKGDASGLTATAITFQSNQAGAKMGWSVSSAGDFNGDGFSDVLVGIPYYDDNVADQGSTRIYFGSGSFFTSAINSSSFTSDDILGAYCGISVATAGDIDGDGFSDVLIGASQNSNGQSKEGTVEICYGSANGDLYTDHVKLEINQANAQFGYSLAPAGDIDADGFSDFIVGARWYTNGQGQDAEGAAFIYRGAASGQLSNPVIIEGDQYNAAMGNKVSSAGDVNGDGYSDILISAYLYDLTYLGESAKDNGRVYLHMGSSTGIDPQPARTFDGTNTDDRMGSSIACAGDVNGDGYSDIMLGAQYYDKGQLNEGAVFIYHGSKGGIVGDPASTMESNQGNGWFGTAVASAGDVNGDGYSDVLIGCYTYDNGQTDEGHVFVYHGGADGVGLDESMTIASAKPSGQMGLSLSSAGDVNSDGYDDVVIGAPYFDEGQVGEGVAFVYYGSINGLNTNVYNKLQKDQANSCFGGTVAGAGDVNGDGYDDVLVGAKDYTAGESNEGVAFLYAGSASGIDQNTLPFTLQVNKADADYGFAVAGAGDINRDGYADIVVGAPTYTLQGSIFVYHGGPNGPNGQIQIDGFYDIAKCFQFGSAVSTAGDVNGDGYSDIIVGAWKSSFSKQGEGAVAIYHGAAAGIQTMPAKWLAGVQVDANFGCSVASAGDVNGDGYSDVIIGARYYDNNESNEGVAMIYYGTSGGIDYISHTPTLLELNVVNAYFGSSVSGAGDVNGDGYSDVIVGAYNLNNGKVKQGKAFVYHGSATGAKTISSFSIEGEASNDALGWSVAGAGDVNGDGYSDVLIGIPGYDNGQAINAGAASLYYGNNGKGLKNNVRLFNSDLITPISHIQFNQPNFVATLFAKSFIGNNKGKFVWETKEAGVSFSQVAANPITTSTMSTGATANYAGLSVAGSVLGSPISKTGLITKVRVRVRYSPVLAITGQMYGPWRYVQRQLAGYNNAPVPEEEMAETIKRKAEPEIETPVSFFPNPASDRLSIQVADPSDIRAVRLYNTSGIPVFQSHRYEKDIDVSKLPVGVYILMLNRANGTPTSHRILIRR